MKGRFIAGRFYREREPVTAPARNPVDQKCVDALDRLDEALATYHEMRGGETYAEQRAEQREALATVREALERLREEREGYKRDFLAALERSEIQETRLRALQEAVSEYIAYPTLAGRRERLELILADLNPDGGSKGFSGGA